MVKLEEKIEDTSKKNEHESGLDSKGRLAANTEENVENTDYDSPAYKIFSSNVFGDKELKSKDDIKIIRVVSENDLKKR